MWFIISVILHGILLLGGIFHWKNYELTAKESPVAKVNMSFSVNRESKSQKITPKKAEVTPENKTQIEKKVEKKPEEKSQKKIKKVERIKEKVQKNKQTEKPEEKNETAQNSTETHSESEETAKVKNFSMEGVTEISEGVYAAKNQGIQGLKYEILFQQDPEYPEIGKKLGYRKTVEVKVRFLVGYNGKIEEIKFYGEDLGMDFRGEVEKALKKWEFSPVTLKEKKIKMYFYKAFVFNQI
ncbi:MAG: cell envelope integrity protein TolA [Fusobacteriaceae bacterium]